MPPCPTLLRYLAVGGGGGLNPVIMKENIIATDFEPDKYVNLIQSMKFGTIKRHDEGSVPEMCIWSILLIISDLQLWCIHLTRSLLLDITILLKA